MRRVVLLAGQLPGTELVVLGDERARARLELGAVVDGRLSGEPLLAALSEASRLSPVLVALVDGRVSALIRTPDVVAAIRP